MSAAELHQLPDVIQVCVGIAAGQLIFCVALIVLILYTEWRGGR